MKMRLLNLLLVILTAALATSLVAATKKAPPKKPASTHHETVGTTQLKGEWGQIGHTYTLGKQNPWNITLNSVEYSVDTLRVDNALIFPNVEEKLLVLHYTIHNPQKRETLMRGDTFHITAVDANDKNWEFRGDIGDEATKGSGSQRLKPGQKLKVYAIIKVPAAGEIPKVIFKSSDNLVIRYDLRGKAKGLQPPYADPADSTGATALAVVPAELGQWYPTGVFAIKVEETSVSEQSIGDAKVDKGGLLFVTKATVKNLNKAALPLRHDSFVVRLKDSDGADLNYRAHLTLRASSDTTLSTRIDPGQELTYRLVTKLTSNIPPAKLTLSGAANGRSFQFGL